MSNKTEGQAVELPKAEPAKKAAPIYMKKRAKPRSKQALATRAATRSVKNRWRKYAKAVSKPDSLKVWARRDAKGKEWLKRKEQNASASS